MRIISFAWTTEAFLAGTKTVTRRMWKEAYVKPGDLMQAWDKSPRAKGKRVGTIKIIKVDREPLHDFLLHGDDEVKHEGGYWKTPGEFISRFLQGNPGMLATDYVWRIEFEKHKETHSVMICRADFVDKEKEAFSLECLRRVAEAETFPLYITRAFEKGTPPVGTVNKVYLEGQELKAEIVVDPYLLETHVFRPGGRVLETHETRSDGKQVKVIDKMDLLDIGAVERSNDVY